MPALRGPRLARRVTESHIIIQAQEIRNTIPILVLPLLERNDTMHNARQLSPRRETKTVADVDDGVAGPWFEEFPAFGLGRVELETPLSGEQEGEGTDVGVLVVAYASGCGGFVVLWIAEEAER